MNLVQTLGADLSRGGGSCENQPFVKGHRKTTQTLRHRPHGVFAAAASIGVGLTLALYAAGSTPACKVLKRLSVPHLEQLFDKKVEPEVTLKAQTLTDELRHRGYSECNPYDFVGLGPYAPYRKLSVGRIAIPQQGGHTDDYGYDVVVHFHGQTALRMTLAQIAKGVAYVGIDLGNGSGAYSDEFALRSSWPRLRDDIERELQSHSGHAQAHIRHVALSAWSAGYGAVNEILRYHSRDIDAVVLLDGLHAAWDPRMGRGTRVEHVTAGPIEPTVEFARQALAGEKLFVFTYSEVDPVLYPSTTLTAQYLMKEIGATMQPQPQSSDPFGMLGAADVMGLHVWSFKGDDKPAHCTHLSHIEHAIRDIVEPHWNTPAMNRDVPYTKAPKLGPALPVSSESVRQGFDVEGKPEARVTKSRHSTTG